MQLNEEEYGKRLEEYSDDTIRLIIKIHGCNRATLYKALKITTNPELNEEQVAEGLKALLEEQDAT
jgi:DNA-binding phage protein